jgi:hypothetical protein
LEAEKQPIATALLPELERVDLAPIIESYNSARAANDTAVMSKEEKCIGALLRPELERRLSLVQQAIDMVVNDPRPVNAGVAELERRTLDTQWWQYVRPEARAIESGREPFIDSPETDFQARSAARRFFNNEGAADRMFAALVHYDRELEAEAIAEGRAFRGAITRVADEGSGRKTIPVWRIEDPTPGPLSIRHGDRVCVVGHAKRSGVVRAIDAAKGGGLALTVEITNIKTADSTAPWPHSMRAADERWIGQVVTIINTSFADMADRKAALILKSDPLPGDWILERPGGDSAELVEPEPEEEVA